MGGAVVKQHLPMSKGLQRGDPNVPDIVKGVHHGDSPACAEATDGTAIPIPYPPKLAFHGGKAAAP